MTSKCFPKAANSAAMLFLTGVGAISPRKKRIALSAVAVLTFLSVPAHAIEPSIAQQKIIVCVYKPSDPSLVLRRAEMIAGEIFAHIGVGIEWHGTGRSCPAAPGQAVPFEVRVSTDTRQDYFPGALGLCKPFDRIHSQIFYDRIRTAVEPDTVPYLLAYTLVHEITHLLQGADRHSDAGVMKARWDGKDFWKMARMKLPFTDRDLVLIQFELEARRGLFPSSGQISSTGVAAQ